MALGEMVGTAHRRAESDGLARLAAGRDLLIPAVLRGRAESAGSNSENAELPPASPPEQLFSLEVLESSWFLFVLKLFNAWSFLLATVSIAGEGINTFLNMFVEFSQYLSSNGRLLGQGRDSFQLVHLMCRALLLVLAYAGCIQCGWWLLVDALQRDMFKNYRRTLCLEGTGPDSFPVHKRRIRLESEEDRMLVHGALTLSCNLDRDIRIGKDCLIKGSQLVARGSLLKAQGCDDPLSVDRGDLLPVDLPAELEFQVYARPAAFDGEGSRFRARAMADLAFQCIIFLSLDLIPLAWSVFNLDSPVELLDLLWLDKLSTTAIKVCTVHVEIYFVMYTFVDYCRKVAGLWKLCHGEEIAAPPPAFQTRRRFWESTYPWRPSRASMPPQVVPERHADEAASLGRADRRSALSRDDALNLCVGLHNLCINPSCHRVLLIVFAATSIPFLILSILGKAGPAMSFGTVSISMLLVLMYFQCRNARRNAIRGCRRFGGNSVHGLPLAQWFRVNCGVTKSSVLTRECFALLVSCLLIACCFTRREAVVPVALPVLICLWSIMVIAALVCSPEKVWIFVFLEGLLFGIACMWVAYHQWKTGYMLKSTRGGVPTWLLIVLTQLGMRRQGKSHVHSIAIAFFLLIVVAIAGLIVVASASATGYMFGNPAHPSSQFCPAESPDCREFLFPLYGAHPYGFCGMSWDMAPGDTVSDRCEDTHLSIVDFGTISTIAGDIANASQVKLDLAEYLAGWSIRHLQTYNLSAGTTTSFVHLVRGSTSVIAVRGTSSAEEVLQDLNLWMRIGFLRLARRIGPSCYSARGVLETFTQNQVGLMGDSIADLAKYVQQVVAGASKREKIYITGHSLGGGLATAIGAINDIPAVTFSAPGLEATSAILWPRPAERQLIHRGLNVVPQYDLVPTVDGQMGTVLNIQCRAKNPFSCHLLSRTMCELLSTCGDGGGRPVPRGYHRSCQSCAEYAGDACVV